MSIILAQATADQLYYGLGLPLMNYAKPGRHKKTAPGFPGAVRFIQRQP